MKEGPQVEAKEDVQKRETEIDITMEKVNHPKEDHNKEKDYIRPKTVRQIFNVNFFTLPFHAARPPAARPDQTVCARTLLRLAGADRRGHDPAHVGRVSSGDRMDATSL